MLNLLPKHQSRMLHLAARTAARMPGDTDVLIKHDAPTMTATCVAPRSRRPKLLAISSGGGHWVQMLRLRPAFADCDVTFVTVHEGYRNEVAGAKFRIVPDSNLSNKRALLRTALAVWLVLLKERPEIVLSTGAAPGFFGVWFGKLLGARSIWVDSVANVDVLSVSGQWIGRHADLWLTQWPHLAGNQGPQFRGSVL
jgi:UDP-N-acetylglucosamine:LPS N-acetylglucosamine transferase